MSNLRNQFFALDGGLATENCRGRSHRHKIHHVTDHAYIGGGIAKYAALAIDPIRDDVPPILLIYTIGHALCFGEGAAFIFSCADV